MKFPDAERHQIFLEPEGHDTHELYVNGLSTSLPAPVQCAVWAHGVVVGAESVELGLQFDEISGQGLSA